MLVESEVSITPSCKRNTSYSVPYGSGTRAYWSNNSRRIGFEIIFVSHFDFNSIVGDRLHDVWHLSSLSYSHFPLKNQFVIVLHRHPRFFRERLRNILCLRIRVFPRLYFRILMLRPRVMVDFVVLWTNCSSSSSKIDVGPFFTPYMPNTREYLVFAI